ncbi:MAG: outer membrane protein OmpA-like peptidoglycan-associated protein [Oleispira sp.]|jgi:outer membrane protein OmpA-like peptidoglycan-associated protein
MRDHALHSFAIRLMVFIGLAFISITSFALEYGGGIEDTEWKVSGSIFECRFEQVLPKYGNGVFYHHSGEDIVFQLETRKNLMKAGKASISITPAPWHPSKKSEHLGFADLVDGRPNLQLDSERSNQFLHALLEGRQPVVTRRTYYDESKIIKIHLSAIRFKDFYSNYLKCVDQLLPMNFSQVARNKIYFGGGKEELSPKDQDLLDRVIFYMKNDPRVFAVYIDGHSDNRGRRYDNRQLSKRRAESVERYFIKQGISTDMVTLRFHGQRYPIASNNTLAGRAKNRRVTVRLEQREDMDIPPELLFVVPD